MAGAEAGDQRHELDELLDLSAARLSTSLTKEKNDRRVWSGWESVLLISVLFWPTLYSGANIGFNSCVSEIKRWYVSTTRAESNKARLAEGSERGFSHALSLNLMQFFTCISD